jgi:mutator family transposase
MTKRTEKTRGTQGATTEAPTLARLLTPLVAGMTTTRQQLLTWVQSAGLVALEAVFREEAAAWAGPKGRHDPTRTHHHWGATPRQLTFGGRQLSVSCPRVRSRAGHEAGLPSVLAFRETDPLTARVMDQLLLGVSTRGYAASLEGAPAGTRSRATSKSAVSRRLVAATRTQLTAQLGRRLDEIDLVALFLDGVYVAGQTLIVALGVAADGRKCLLGIRLGSTENSAICTDLLHDLVTRGLRLDGRVLCVIDGGKGLRKALGGCAGHAGGHPALPTAQAAEPACPGPAAAPAPGARGPAPGVSRRERGGRSSPAASPGRVAREQRASRRRGESPRRAGGDPHCAQAGAAGPSPPLLCHHELHREPRRDAAARYPQREALAPGRYDSPVGRPRPAPRRRALPSHPAPS